jgi:hypothetical protein
MIALVGDAELDEGNIFESILEGWKQGLRNCWWIVDYNRQSLDAVVREGLWERYEQMFRNFGWDVMILKYATQRPLEIPTLSRAGSGSGRSIGVRSAAPKSTGTAESSSCNAIWAETEASSHPRRIELAVQTTANASLAEANEELRTQRQASPR